MVTDQKRHRLTRVSVHNLEFLDEELVYQWSPYSATLKCCQSNEIKCHNISKLLYKCGIRGVLGADVAFDPRVKMIISFFRVLIQFVHFCPEALWVGNRSLRSNQLNQLLSWSFNQVYHRFYLLNAGSRCNTSCNICILSYTYKISACEFILFYNLSKGYIKLKKIYIIIHFRFLSFVEILLFAVQSRQSLSYHSFDIKSNNMSVK